MRPCLTHQNSWWALVIGVTLFMTSLPMLASQVPSSESGSQKAVLQTITPALYDAESRDVRAFKSHLTPGFIYMTTDNGTTWILCFPLLIGYGNRRSSPLERHDAGHSHSRKHGMECIRGRWHHDKRKWNNQVQWLESAFLTKSSGIWKIEFWHRTCVSVTEQAGTPSASSNSASSVARQRSCQAFLTVQ
jgi:hypothetical protein